MMQNQEPAFAPEGRDFLCKLFLALLLFSPPVDDEHGVDIVEKVEDREPHVVADLGSGLPHQIMATAQVD
jgi:hypothetical protein